MISDKCLDAIIMLPDNKHLLVMLQNGEYAKVEVCHDGIILGKHIRDNMQWNMQGHCMGKETNDFDIADLG